jgi:uncharacterized RDD family membrane protein YckC
MIDGFEIADKGTRLGNFFIDTIIYALISLIFLVLLLVLFPQPPQEESGILEFLPAIFYFLYYFLFETALGKTPGKYLTKTIVVDGQGNKPGLKNIFIRTLSRLIPFDIISYVFGFTGFHDLVSKTSVIKRKPAAF